MNESTFYLTTAIPYVNGAPHIGHALEFVQSDVIARYHRIIGDDTYFLSGVDENSLKNVRAAEDLGVSTQELCDSNAQLFKDLADNLDVSIDNFVRTSAEFHHRGAQVLWSACKTEDIYVKSYSGHYCVGCEAFYTNKELLDGKCSEHNSVPEIVEEENYFFKLSNYQNILLNVIESGELKIVPEFRKNEVVSFIKMGLEDFSISRSQARTKNWGVTVPGDPSQVMYVWFDALSNYITGLGYGSADTTLFDRYWPADVHVIGKGISRFHAIYWPAMLLSAGIPLPKSIFIHGYISVDGQKMSKSLGNIVDPFELVHSYGSDAVRYYLLREIPPSEDGDFSEDKFVERYNADLANDLGNLVSRVSNMVERYLGGTVPELGDEDMPYDLEQVQRLTSQYKFNEALDKTWDIIRLANKIVEDEKPWDLFAKSNTDKLETVLARLVVMVRDVSLALEPFLPQTAATIQQQFNAATMSKTQPLFPRIL